MPSLPPSHPLPLPSSNVSLSSVHTIIDSASTTRAHRIAQRHSGQTTEGPTLDTVSTLATLVEPLDRLVVQLQAIALHLGVELAPLPPPLVTDTNYIAPPHRRLVPLTQANPLPASEPSITPPLSRTTSGPLSQTSLPLVTETTTVTYSIMPNTTGIPTGAAPTTGGPTGPPNIPHPNAIVASENPAEAIPADWVRCRRVDPHLYSHMPIRQCANPPPPKIVRTYRPPCTASLFDPPHEICLVEQFQRAHAQAIRRARLRRLIPDWTEQGLGDLTVTDPAGWICLENNGDPYEALFDLYPGEINPSLAFHEQPSEHQDMLMDAYVVHLEQEAREAANADVDSTSHVETWLMGHQDDVSALSWGHGNAPPPVTDHFDPIFQRRLEERAIEVRHRREHRIERQARDGHGAPPTGWHAVPDHVRLPTAAVGEGRQWRELTIHRTDRDAFRDIIERAQWSLLNANDNQPPVQGHGDQAHVPRARRRRTRAVDAVVQHRPANPYEHDWNDVDFETMVEGQAIRPFQIAPRPGPPDIAAIAGFPRRMPISDNPRGPVDNGPTPSSPTVAAGGPGPGFQAALLNRVRTARHQRAEMGQAPVPMPTVEPREPRPNLYQYQRGDYRGTGGYPRPGISYDGRLMIFVSRSHHENYIHEVEILLDDLGETAHGGYEGADAL